MPSLNILEKGKTPGQAQKAIILLHGRGGTAANIIALADHFTDDSFYVAAPQAINNTWYPYSFLSPENLNEPWLSIAVETVFELLDNIRVHIPPEKIYLMGFSQGACLSLEVASRNAIKYAGIAAFTGGLIGEEIDKKKYKGSFNGTKVFLGNSDNDPHVPLQRSEESRDIMKSLGAEVLLKIYPGMDHTIIPDEIHAVKKFMF